MAAREKTRVVYKGIPTRLSAGLWARREWHDTFKVLKKKNVS